MKKVAIAVAALAAWWCFGSPEEWFNPAGSKEVYYTAIFYYEDPQTHEAVSWTVEINPETGEINISEDWRELMTIEQYNAMLAMQEALRARNSVGTLAEHIKSLLKNGMILSGKDANGNTIVQRLTFSRGLNADGKPLEGSTDAIYDFADGESIVYSGGTMPKLGIAGFDGADNLTMPMKTLEGLDWVNVVGRSIEPFHDPILNKVELELSGFSTRTTHEIFTLADCLTNNTEVAGKAKVDLIVRDSNGAAGEQFPSLSYMSIGKLLESAGSVKVDGVSIATNEEGVVSLRGFDEEAGDAAIIQRDGVVTYARTVSANRYLGTPSEGSDLGFWDLPNVTTNRVEGDEATITTVYNEGGLKRLGLKEPPEPSIIVNSGGYAAYAPLPEMETEMKVDGESIVTNEQGQVQLANWGDFVGSALPRFVTVQNGNELAPYDFPSVGVATQVDLVLGDYGLAGIISGWYQGTANCTVRICDMIEQDTDAKKEAAGDHWVLTKNISTGNLHFTPFGTPSAKYGLRHAEGAGDVAVTETKMGDFVTNLVVRLKQNAREPSGTASAFVTGVNDDGEMVRSAVNFEAAENIGLIEQKIVTMGDSICENWWKDAGTWDVITNKLDGTYCRAADCQKLAQAVVAVSNRVDEVSAEATLALEEISRIDGDVQYLDTRLIEVTSITDRLTIGEDGALYFDGRRLKFADE